MQHLALGLVIALAGCSTGPAPLPPGAVARTVALSADHNSVPRELMLAVAAVEGGLLLSQVRMPDPDDHVAVAGVLELRHGAFNSLARGAALVGSDELALRADTDLATEAGARVLAELGRATHARVDDLASWRDAVEQLSGMSDYGSRAHYAADVFTILRAGGIFPARGGESITISAHPDLEIARAGVAIEAVTGTPDFATASWFATSCNGKCDTTRTAGDAAVDLIIIHDTEGGWNAAVATLQNDAGKSVHYIVDADGSRVGQFVPETYTAWHAGNYYVNQRSVGIEHVGFASDPAGYSEGLYRKSSELVKSIRSRWPVPLDRTHIYGHYQVANGNIIGESAEPCTDTLDNCETSANYGGGGNHRDPGLHWQWCQYMQLLGGSCTCNDTYALWNCTTDRTQAVRCVNGKVEIQACTAGCVSQSIGSDDICNLKAPTGGGGSGGTGGGGEDGGMGSSGDPGTAPPATGGNGDTTPNAALTGTTGGCSFGGGAPSSGGAWIYFFFVAAALTLGGRRAMTSLRAPRGRP